MMFIPLYQYKQAKSITQDQSFRLIPNRIVGNIFQSYQPSLKILGRYRSASEIRGLDMLNGIQIGDGVSWLEDTMVGTG